MGRLVGIAIAVSLPACNALLGIHEFSTDAPPSPEVDAPPIDALVSRSCLDGLWCHRKAISIDENQVIGGPHTNFPILLQLAVDDDLAANARVDGFDLVFTAADGITRLPHELEQFSKSSGALTAWVKVPSLTSASVTTLYLYFGNPDASNQEQKRATWADDYKGVWHLSEITGGAIADSTSHSNDGALMNSPELDIPAVIGTGVRFDGGNDVLQIPNSTSLDSTATAATFSLWINWVDATDGGYQLVMSTSNSVVSPKDGYTWGTQSDGSHYLYPWVGDSNNYNLGPSPFTDGTAQYLVATLEFATREVKIYVNGAAMVFTVVNIPIQWTTAAAPAAWLWGGNPDLPSGYFRGVMDEIRVANVVRSAGWIATEYRNQSTPSTFYSVGAVEVLLP